MAEYTGQGVRLLAIDNHAPAGDWPARSYLVLQHLQDGGYDAAFFDDLAGNGYFALLARRTGAPALARTRMVVTAHGALEWVTEQDEIAILKFDGLPLFEMERRSIELADVVKAPSRYILSKYASFGWSVPDNRIVLPNFVSQPRQRKAANPRLPRPVDDIVFFGRLETRKGIWLFLRAIDRIKFRLQGKTVTFLGKSSGSANLILRHSLGWPCRTNLFTDYDQEQALAYLKRGRTLAVMPSPEDNSPSTVLECLDEGIPFLASSGSGAEELNDPACHKANLVEPTVAALAERILQAVETGGRVGRHSFDPNTLLADFEGWFRAALKAANAGTVMAAKTAPAPAAVIALVPGGQTAERSAAQLGEAASRLDPGTVLHVLCDDPAALRARLPDAAIHIHGAQALHEIPSQLAPVGAAAVALCASDRIPDRHWFDRAAICLAGDISAVTGMTRAVATTAKEPTDPWLSPAQGPVPTRYLIGNAPALLTLMQSTNSGFAVLRADALASVDKAELADPASGRMHPAQAILHQLLAGLLAEGRRFEVIPDLVTLPASLDPLAETSGGGRALRLAEARLGPGRGDLWAVNRLAVDTAIDRLRQTEAEAAREALSHRTGLPVSAFAGPVAREEQSLNLAGMAMAAGQVELAARLLADLRPSHRKGSRLGLSELVDAEAAALDLLEQYRAGLCTPINLMHSYSIAMADTGELKVHANAETEPRAAIAFPDLDLRPVDSFFAEMSLPNPDSLPVRVRIDMIAGDGTGHHTSERVLKSGKVQTIRLPLPPDMRTRCRVVIGVEMADPQATNAHAYVMIVRPQFLRLGDTGEAA